MLWPGRPGASTTRTRDEAGKLCPARSVGRRAVRWPPAPVWRSARFTAETGGSCSAGSSWVVLPKIAPSSPFPPTPCRTWSGCRTPITDEAAAGRAADRRGVRRAGETARHDPRRSSCAPPPPPSTGFMVLNKLHGSDAFAVKKEHCDDLDAAREVLDEEVLRDGRAAAPRRPRALPGRSGLLPPLPRRACAAGGCPASRRADELHQGGLRRQRDRRRRDQRPALRRRPARPRRPCSRRATW